MSDVERNGSDIESIFSDLPRFRLANVGDAEDLELYREGGLHPTNIGDIHDDGRYRIVHKLGAGGFSTVWLARDSHESRWVALKFVRAEISAEVEGKALMCQKLVSDLNTTNFVTFERYFYFEGPNGRHLCFVQPFLGPSTNCVSQYMHSRIRPRLARRVCSQVVTAVAELHSRGVCHGGESNHRTRRHIPFANT